MTKNEDNKIEKEKNTTSKKDNHEQINKFEEEIKELKNKNKSLEEEVLHSKADLINYRKRKDDEVSGMLKYANSDLLLQIITIIDNFERALNTKTEDLTKEMENYLVGFKMIYTSLKQVLENNGVKEIDCLGKKFDSNYEASLFTESNNDLEDDIVLEVLQKGYTYYDKVLRHASVKINKKENKENI